MRRYFFSLLLAFCCTSLNAQKISSPEFWRVFIPDYVRVQFAGSVGALSMATGWTYGRRETWESDIGFGIVPPSSYDKSMGVISLKQSYLPWSIDIKDSGFSFTPLTCGLFFSFVLDDNFWLTEPEKYDPPYYGFSTMARLNLFLGQSITYNFKSVKSIFSAISGYYEFSSCDFKIVSALTNSHLNIADYLSFAVGVRVIF